MITVLIARETVVVERNLLAQVGVGKFVKPSHSSLTMWYDRQFLESTTLEDAFAEAQELQSLRSAMPGDILQMGETYHLILPVGFEEFTPAD